MLSMGSTKSEMQVRRGHVLYWMGSGNHRVEEFLYVVQVGILCEQYGE